MRGLISALIVAISVFSSFSCYIPDGQAIVGGESLGSTTSTKTSASPSQSTPSGSLVNDVVDAGSSKSFSSSVNQAASATTSASVGSGSTAASATTSASMISESTGATTTLDYGGSAPFYPDVPVNGLKVVLSSNGAVVINVSVSDNAGPNIPPGFVSFSLDDASLVGYLGPPGEPYMMSVNLLQNLGDKMGVMPLWRIIGDSFFFDPDQKEAEIRNKAPGGTSLKGPTYFESFANFPNTQYIMGLNFAWTDANAEKNRFDTITAVCQKLTPSMIELWEMGNEPDLYPDNGSRPRSYTVQDHAKEYVDATNAARAHMATSCSGFSSTFMGTSIIGGASSKFDVVKSFEIGINDHKAIDLLGTHSYTSFEGTPKATLANLMNHNFISTIIGYHSQIGVNCVEKDIQIPYILGETNSIAGGGTPGITDVFGAALYTVDFSLRGAASGILRTHTHTGMGASYNAWEPAWGYHDMHQAYVGAPYYGHIFVAEVIGSKSPRIVEIGLPGNFNDAAYAIYENEKIARIAIINFESVSHLYKFEVGRAGEALRVSILDAPDKSSKTGITFDGYSYTPESDGKPVLSNPAGSTTVTVDSQGDISLTVKGVQAVMIHVV